MNRILSSVAVAAFVLAAGSGFADAKSCRGAHGKFVKCPAAAHAMAKKPCRDAKGKFMKCK